VSGKTVNFNVTVTAIKIKVNTHTFPTDTKNDFLKNRSNKIKAAIIGTITESNRTNKGVMLI
jgi:hypothetical protein